MYQIRCDEFILYDPRDEELILLNPRCKLEVNTVGEGSFTILSNHPYYDKLQKLKSIFEVRQDGQTIFRGRMTNDSRDFQNRLDVDLEGVLAFTNDSIIGPFDFPKDFPGAADATNVVEYFLRWILGQHNAQVQDWQKLKLGTVTVKDPNNYITRVSTDYDTTWDILKSKLFGSSLGGYLCVRYESDGNYVDYLDKFELTNTQRITFGKNLLDITSDSDASETYSAIMPIGATIEETITVEGEDYEGMYGTITGGSTSYTVKKTITLDELPDGDLTDDLVKMDKFIYSKSAVDSYGWICVPPKDSQWDDVTEVNNLKNKAIEYLTGTAMLLSSTITIKAVDLYFTDDQIQSFRIYRNILVDSPVHGVEGVSYQLTKLDIDIMNPQNTTVTIGDTVRTLVDVNDQHQSTTTAQVRRAAQMTEQVKQNVVETVHQQLVVQETSVTTTCSEMILAALEQYVQTGEYNQFKQTVEAQLEIMADEIIMRFTSTTENINDVAGDLQAEITQRKKHITFSENGITLGAGENAMALELDNDMIKFKKNGVQFGWWDGVDFHTGNIVVDVNERAQLGNFAFIPRSDGSLMFLKVGG